MGFGRQISVLGSVVWVAGMLLQAEAMAFGQQWRPVAGYGPGPQAGMRQLPNRPAFRPHTPTRPAVARPALSKRQPSFHHRRYVQTYPQRFTAARFDPMAAGVPPHLSQHVPPGYTAFAHPASGWLPPPLPPAGAWGQQVPLFARQFAWQPAPHPWVPRPSAGSWQRGQTGMAPRAAGYLSPRPLDVQGPGRWHPADQWAGMWNQRLLGGVPAPAWADRPWAGPSRAATYSAAGIRTPEATARPGAVLTSWRPQRKGQPVVGQSNPSFRPRAYGRRPAVERRVAARPASADRVGRGRLPGWLTTHEELGGEGACSWCSDS